MYDANAMLNKTNTAATLEAKNLAKSYSKRAIVKDVSIRVESLNVSVATGVLLYEMVRQRAVAARAKAS